jgi:hypothetical protein
MSTPNAEPKTRKPYSGAYRDELDEPDTEVDPKDPKAAQTQGADDTPEVDDKDLPPEERTFKKRYSDLRRHNQKVEKELKDEIAALKAKVSTPKDYTPPKNPEELRRWVEQFPEVAANIETIADQRANQRIAELQTKLEKLEARSEEVVREKTEAEILRVHTDFNDLRDTDDFHEWVEQQPTAIQNWLYENTSDAVLAIRAVDLYKKDRGLDVKDKRKSKKQDAAAAELVETSRKIDDPMKPTGKIWKTSEIARLKGREFEKYEAEIDKAMAEGRIENDI